MNLGKLAPETELHEPSTRLSKIPERNGVYINKIVYSTVKRVIFVGANFHKIFQIRTAQHSDVEHIVHGNFFSDDTLTIRNVRKFPPSEKKSRYTVQHCSNTHSCNV